MAQIKNYQQLELLSTNFLRRDETDPLTIASLDVFGNVDIGGNLDVTGTLGVTGLATVNDLDVGGNLDVIGSTSGIDHGGLDGLGDDDHNDATNGYILREPNAGVEDAHLVLWHGTGGRNLINSSAYMSGDHLYCDGWIYADYDATQSTKIGGNSIELGSPGTAGGASYIDFHGDPTESDYDARIGVSGGTGTTGYGEMTLTARGGINLSVSPNDVYINNDIKIASTGDYYHGTYVGCIYHPLSSEVEVLNTSTSSDSSANQIDMSTKGMPTSPMPVAYNLKIAIRDSGSASHESYIELQSTSAGGTYGSWTCPSVDDWWGRFGGITFNCDTNGDIWWTANASGASTLDIKINVNGYWL